MYKGIASTPRTRLVSVSVEERTIKTGSKQGPRFGAQGGKHGPLPSLWVSLGWVDKDEDRLS